MHYSIVNREDKSGHRACRKGQEFAATSEPTSDNVPYPSRSTEFLRRYSRKHRIVKQGVLEPPVSGSCFLSTMAR